MVVGAGHRHHLGYAELAQPAFRDGGELRWISDRTGGDDRALTLHQPGHRRHGPDAARIGEHDGGATQVIGGQLSRAGFRDQRFVLIAERRKIQPVRIANHRHQQHPAAVLPLHVDRQPQVDAAGHPSGRAVDPLECHRHRGNVLHRAHDRKSDQVRVRNLLRPPRGLDRLVELPPSLVENVDWLRKQTDLPICIGFGISRPEHVKLLAPVADGLIVGSGLVRRVAEAATQPRQSVLKDVGDYAALLLSSL